MSVKKFTRKQLAFADGGYAQELANQNPELLKDKVFQMALNDERQSQASALQSDWEQAQHDAAWSRGHVLTPSQRLNRAQEMGDLVGRSKALGIQVPGLAQGRRSGSAFQAPMDFTPADISAPPSQPLEQHTWPKVPDIKVAPGIGESDLTGISSGIGGDPMLLGVTYANGGSIINRQDGGPIVGGPPGVDTVPGKVGNNKVLLNNGEYVLPKGVVKKIGKDRLDEMVVGMTGKAPVGYELGGRFDRKKQLGEAEQKAPDAGTPVVPTPQEIAALQEKNPSLVADVINRAKEVGSEIWQAPSVGAGLGTVARHAVSGYKALGTALGETAAQAVMDAQAAYQGDTPQVSPNPAGSYGRVKESAVSPAMNRTTYTQGPGSKPALLPKPTEQTANWNYSQGPMGELVAKTPRGEATFYSGTGAGRASPIGLDATTMQEAARNIASGKPPGGTVSYVSGPGSYGMSEAEWKALPNDQKIARNVEYYNNAAKAVRDVTNTQRAYEGRPAVGAENTMPLRPSDQIAMASLQERAQDNAIARGIAAENARAVGVNAMVNKDKALRERNAAVQTEIDNMPAYGALPRDLLWAQVSRIAQKKNLSPEVVNQQLALYLTRLGFPTNKYGNTPEEYAKLEEALKAFEVGLK